MDYFLRTFLFLSPTRRTRGSGRCEATGLRGPRRHLSPDCHRCGVARREGEAAMGLADLGEQPEGHQPDADLGVGGCALRSVGTHDGEATRKSI